MIFKWNVSFGRRGKETTLSREDDGKNGRLEGRKSPWLLPLLALFSGGLAGAVFTWYVNRPTPTIVTYNVVSTTLASPDAATSIPNLTVQVGNEKVTALYAHTVTFSCPEGPFAERGDIAITFRSKVKIYGQVAEAPSPLHAISCSRLTDGVRCYMAPISPDTGNSTEYRVTISTNESAAPRVELVGKNIKLVTRERYLADQSWPLNRRLFSILGALAAGIFFTFLSNKRRTKMNRLLIVGKILAQGGTPVEGATIELVVETPSLHQFSPEITDKDGDFILGGRGKGRSAWREDSRHSSKLQTPFNGIQYSNYSKNFGARILQTGSLKPL